MAGATEIANYTVALQDETSGAANTAASALSNLRERLDEGSKSLAAMRAAQRNLKAGGMESSAQFKELTAKISAQKIAIGQAQSAYLSLGGSFLKMKPPAESVSSVLDALKKNMHQVGGPLGNLTSQFEHLSSMLAGGAMTLGLVAVAAAFVALTAAAIGAYAALGKYGIETANARRNELLHLEGLTKLRNWYGIAAGNAGQMQRAIDKASASTSLGRDKMAEYGNTLYKAGVRGENYALALEAMGIKGAAVGDKHANAFASLAAHISFAGGSVKKYADDIKARFGGIVMRQMLDLNTQFSKMKENIGMLFADVKIEGFLKALYSVTSLFSQAEATGRALKAIVGVIFKPLNDSATATAPLIKRFFQGIVIGALLVTINVLKLKNFLVATFSTPSIFKGLDYGMVMLRLGTALVGSLVVAFGALAIAITTALAPFTALAAVLFKVGSIIGAVFMAWDGQDWSVLGKNLVSGIVKGITGTAHTVVDAVKNMGGEAWRGFKTKLGISSPSKEFAKLGLNISQGVVQGVDTGKSAVTSTVSGLVKVPPVSEAISNNRAPSDAKGGAAKPASSQVFTFGDIYVNTKADDPKAQAASIRDELMNLLTGAATQMGAG